MYAKAFLGSGAEGAPLLLATFGSSLDVAPRLHRAGWQRFGGDIVAVDGVVLVGADASSLEVWADGTQLLRDDAEPQGPPDWWNTIAINGHRVVVVFFPLGTPIGTATPLDHLLDHHDTAQGLLPVAER